MTGARRSEESVSPFRGPPPKMAVGSSAPLKSVLLAPVGGPSIQLGKTNGGGDDTAPVCVASAAELYSATVSSEAGAGASVVPPTLSRCSDRSAAAAVVVIGSIAKLRLENRSTACAAASDIWSNPVLL